MFLQFCDTPVGRIVIRSDGELITEVAFCDEPVPALENELTQLAAKQIQEYFDGKRQVFDLPLRFDGTPFTQAVCKTLAQVPFGTTTTYGLLAAMAGYPGACRAVGTVMRKNRLLLVLPCHRVLAANGLGGYACGLEKKRWLLRFEGINFAE